MVDTTAVDITAVTAGIGLVATLEGNDIMGAILTTAGVTRTTDMDGDSALALAGRLRIRRRTPIGMVLMAEPLLRHRLAIILLAIIVTRVSAQGMTTDATPTVMLRRRTTRSRTRPGIPRRNQVQYKTRAWTRLRQIDRFGERCKMHSKCFAECPQLPDSAGLILVDTTAFHLKNATS